ncbi:hypothetical protein PFISCL1PPCAC_20823, partial [Pristionchus fissidentatus]
FLRRHTMLPYAEGKQFLAANGPFLELFDVECTSAERKGKDNEGVTKTRVFERSHIYHILPANDGGHVIAISAESRDGCRKFFARIVHRGIILNGGYAIDASLHQLCESDSAIIDSLAEVVENTNEV